MKKPQKLLIVFLLLISSYSFSQSGAAKSLEIGNKWLFEHTYVYAPYDSERDTTITYIFNEVIKDTIIGSKNYAVIKRIYNRYTTIRGGNVIKEEFIIQRADSNKVYRMYSNGEEGVVSDYTLTQIVDYCDTEWQLREIGFENYYGLEKEYQIWHICNVSYENRTVVKGIGTYRYFLNADAIYHRLEELIAIKIDGERFGDSLPTLSILPELQYTRNKVKFKLNNNSSSLARYIKYKINNAEWLDVLPNTEVLSISIEEEGNYNIEFSILNVFDESYSDFATFVVDRTPPTIKVDNELDSSVYLKSFSQISSIQYEIIDENFDKISYSLNEADTVWVDQQSSSIPLIDLENKNYLEITAYDLAKNSTTKSYEIIVDSTIPKIEFNYPLELINLLVNDGNQLSLDYKVIEKYFDKIGYCINNSEWIWSEEKESTFNITVENDDDHIQIKAFDLAGNESDIYEINVEKIADFKLTQNFPNPFNPTTQISYELPQDSEVELIIYNSLGEEVNTLVNSSQSIGRYTINWNGLNSSGEQVPGGLYFYTLKTKDFTQTRKMLLLR